jgi:ABC-type sugar transport system permease subunit
MGHGRILLARYGRVWLGNPDTAIYAIIASRGRVSAALLFSVAIRCELYDARMDGAGALRQIWSITLP